MRTSEEIYHRVRWDPRFDPARFMLGINVRGAEPKRVPLPAFTPGGDIPWHRVLFIEADGEVIWDRSAGVDRIDDSRAGRVADPRRLCAPYFSVRTPYVWNEIDGWGPAGPPRPSRSSAAALRILTWNTLWDKYDSDRIRTAHRRPLLLSALERSGADVIALQEVETGLLALLREAEWVRRDYTIDVDPYGREVEESGLLLLSRLPVVEAGQHVFSRHKAVAATTLLSAAGPLVVAVTHLTSDHSENGRAKRAAELDDLAHGLAGVPGELILVGDFNDGGDTPAAALDLRDAWVEVHGYADDTPTFDPVANPLAAVSSLTGRASRLDRVLLRGDGFTVDAATLCGDSPATPDGLHPSDHYGVQVDLTPGGAGAMPGGVGQAPGGAGIGVIRSQPTARTALAWIPPRGLLPAIDSVRREHDPQFDRWPPHVNLLFGFVPESDFDDAVAIVAEVAAGIAPFTARLARVRAFAHRDDATVWLDPAAADSAPWTALHGALRPRFPRCRGRAEGYVPHLTLGRTRDPGKLAGELAARVGATEAVVDEIVMLSRRGDEPMRPRVAVALGTGRVRWLSPSQAGDMVGRASSPADRPPRSPAFEPAEESVAGQVRERLSAALPDAIVHAVGSRRMGCASVGADLDLIAVVPGTGEAADLAAVRALVVSALPEATAVRGVVGARVPGLRFRVGDLDVDLAVVASGRIAPAQAVQRRVELPQPAAIALSAVSDADAVLAAMPTPAARAGFASLARRVKAWARVRGLDSAPHGGLPGLAWVILAARTVYEADDLGIDELVRRFFGTWAAWDWREPVSLPGHITVAGAPAVSIATPTVPVRLCTEQVGIGMRDLLTQEFYEAWETAESADPWPRLLAPPPLHRRHVAWAVLTVSGAPGEEFETYAGRVRGRMRGLLTALEEAGSPDLHAWPRPFHMGPGRATYAIGLGRTPPDRGHLAEIVVGWRGGLPSVKIELVEGGAVPTLR